MEKDVREETQMRSAKEFEKEVAEGKTDASIVKTCTIIERNLGNLKDIEINGQKISEHKDYNKIHQLFTEMSVNAIDRFNLLKIFDFTDSEINDIKEEKNKENVLLAIQEKLKIDVNDKEINEQKILLGVAQKITKDINRKMVETLYFSNDEANRIIRGLKEIIEFGDYKLTEPKQEKYYALNLYRDAYEIYIKILRESYLKIAKPSGKRRGNNKFLYEFYNKNYPPLAIKSLLRNDVSHLNYDTRDNYTTEQINEERDLILVKSIIGLIARHEFILNFFKAAVENIKEMKKNSVDDKESILKQN